jgi:putative membrane protein
LPTRFALIHIKVTLRRRVETAPTQEEQEEDAMWWNDYWSMPWMFFGPMMMIIFVIICVTLMFLIMRGGTWRGRNADAVDILRERYARGEINQTEFEERRRFLEA